MLSALKWPFGSGGKQKQPDVEAVDFVEARKKKRPEAFNRLSELLPYTGYEEKSGLFFIEADGPDTIESLGFCIEIRPQTGASEAMADYLTSLFMANSPVGTGVQVQMFGSPDLTSFYEAFDKVTRDEGAFPDDPERARVAKLMHRMMLKRKEHYRKGATTGLFEDMNFRLRDFRSVVSVVVPVPKKLDGKYQNIDEFLKSPEAESLRQETIVLRETYRTALASYFLFEKIWGPDDLMNWCSLILNAPATMAGDSHRLSYDEGRLLRHQIVRSDTKLVEDELDITFSDSANADVVMRALSVRNYPKIFCMNQMNDLIGSLKNTTLSYPCPFLITLGVRTLDFEAERNKVVVRAARATQGAESNFAKFQPDLIDKKYDWDIAQGAYDEGKGTIKMYLQVLLFSNRQEISKSEQAARAIWRATNFDITTDRKMQKQALLASMPMMYGPLMQRDLQIAFRSSTKTIYNAANMMPIIAEPTGVGAPVVPLFGRRGQAMGIDLFSNPTGNFNGCVVGTSGSGKSVLLNDIATRTISTGGRVWIFDVGYSYQKMCRTIGGQFLQFKPDSNISLNPFSMITDIDADMEMLKPLIAQMISPNAKLEPYQLAQVEINIRQLWAEYGQETTITKLAERLKKACYQGGSKEAFNDEEVPLENCDPRIRDLGVQLFPFTEEGAYGRYFMGKANVEFNSDLVVLELQELNGMKDLQGVVLLLLMYKITQEMYLGDRSKKKVVIIDEAWQLLSGGSAAEFIEAGYRTARKFGGSFLTGTQSINDYYKTPAALAALENADWLFLLRQKAESVEALAKSDKLVIDDETKQIIKSVTKIDGRFSEVFVRCGDIPPTVGRLIVDPYSLLLYSTKAEDAEAVRRYVDAGVDTADAISLVLRDRGIKA